MMLANAKAAVVQHALDLAGFYLRNAHLVRGVPDQPNSNSISLSASTTTTATSSPTSQNPVLPSPSTPTPQSAIPAWVKTAGIIGLSALAGGSAIGIPLSMYLSKTTVEKSSGSLLQYLEDTGFHISPKPEVKP